MITMPNASLPKLFAYEVDENCEENLSRRHEYVP